MWEAKDRGSTGAVEEETRKFRRRWGDWEMQGGKEVAKKFCMP